jgi:hypothetical protein
MGAIGGHFLVVIFISTKLSVVVDSGLSGGLYEAQVNNRHTDNLFVVNGSYPGIQKLYKNFRVLTGAIS